MNRLERLEKAFVESRWQWLGENVIAVVVVDDQEVLVALTRRNGKLAGEVGRDLTGDLVHSKVAEVRFVVWVVRVREGFVIHEDFSVGFAGSRGRTWPGWFRLRRLDVLARMSLVALDGGLVKRRMETQCSRS